MTDLTTRREPAHRDPDRDPEPDPDPDHAALLARREEQGAGTPSAVPDGVELSRLLALARLTTAQALEIGAGVLAAAATEPASGDGGPGSAPSAVAPFVGADGRVALGATGNGGRPVDAVLADVAAAARLPSSAAGPAADQCLAALDEAARDLAEAGVPVVAGRLQEAAAGIDRAAVRAELSALVRAVGGAGSSASGAPPTGGPPVPARGGRVERPPRRPRSAGRRIGAWLLSILVLVGTVVAEIVLLRDDIAADIDTLLDAGRGGVQPAAAPAPDGPTPTAPAPAAAGSVVGVDLRPLGPCAPGAPCTLRLLVRLVPAAEPQVVAWSYQVVDRCTGSSSTAPGGSITVPPKADRVEAVGVVPLPPVVDAAVMAVTAAPAVAASAPVLVGSCQPTGENG